MKLSLFFRTSWGVRRNVAFAAVQLFRARKILRRSNGLDVGQRLICDLITGG